MTRAMIFCAQLKFGCLVMILVSSVYSEAKGGDLGKIIMCTRTFAMFKKITKTGYNVIRDMMENNIEIYC